jgi:PAS domain S-box-containing protein
MEPEASAPETPAELVAIHEMAPVGLAFVDRSLRYVRVNARLAAIHGRTPEEHLGRTVREVLGDAQADLIEPLYRKIIETGQPVVNREPRRPRGARLHDQIWLSNYYPLVIDGEVAGVNVVVQDISDTKRGEDRQVSFDALLANMSEGFAMCDAVWDADGSLTEYIVLELNAALQAMLGVGPEAIGRKLSDSPGIAVPGCSSASAC